MENRIEQKIKGNYNIQENIENKNVTVITIPLEEEKIREISSKTARDIAIQYFELGQDIANKRMKCLEDIVMNRFRNIENGMMSFSNPSFILSYRKAQIQSATTDQESSYQMLSELLVHRHEKSNVKYAQTGIDGAIEIVNQISDSSLTALTLFACVNANLIPITNDLSKGLEIISNLYDSIIICDLPNDSKWMDQLDILKAVRIDNINKFKKFREIIQKNYDNYSCAGIKKDSEEYFKALEIQKNYDLNILIKNELLEEEYFIVPIFSASQIEKLVEVKDGKTYPLTTQQIDAIHQLLNLYTENKNDNEKALEGLVSKMLSYTSLNKLKIWWDSLPLGCHLTEIGRVLGHANAKKCYKEFPPLY